LPNKIYNTHLIISDDGIEIGKYRKLHLFDVDIKNGPVILESTGIAYGDHIISPISTPLGEVGMAVCYDLRFPELSTELRKRGADILTYPSAFTVKTGQAHWGNYNKLAKSYQSGIRLITQLFVLEILLRARAIENQTYVVARQVITTFSRLIIAMLTINLIAKIVPTLESIMIKEQVMVMLW